MSSHTIESELNLAYYQADLVWQDIEANKRALERWLAEQTTSADLIVLPEMFLTGFTMQPERYAQDLNAGILQWLLELSQHAGAALCGSLAVNVHDQAVNRFVFVTPEGRSARYDKRHLFTMGDEPEHYLPGQERVLIHYRGWRILPSVCYDLRFPIWCRNRNDYDLMICVANWPAPRAQAWQTLLKARAIENQVYVIGVNRVGEDGRGLSYSGDSMIVDFKGHLLSQAPPEQVFTDQAGLSLADLEAFKEKFPAFADADPFTLDSVSTRIFEL